MDKVITILANDNITKITAHPNERTKYSNRI